MKNTTMTRIWLVRILIALWLIPVVWLIVWPLWWLMFGDPECTTRECRALTGALWFGVD